MNWAIVALILSGAPPPSAAPAGGGAGAPRFAQVAVSVPQDWIDSPEAYFATNSERREWLALERAEDRARYIERYWLKRDPTPATTHNEFREVILDRIRKADQKFAVGSTPGSRTGQGRVFVIFGPPARMRNAYVSPDAVRLSRRTDRTRPVARPSIGRTI